MGWPTIDRHLAIAEMRIERMTGPNGEWLPDATSDEADPMNYEGTYRPFVRGPFTNHWEKARLDVIDAWKKKAGEDANMNGLYWITEVMQTPGAPR